MCVTVKTRALPPQVTTNKSMRLLFFLSCFSKEIRGGVARSELRETKSA